MKLNPEIGDTVKGNENIFGNHGFKILRFQSDYKYVDKLISINVPKCLNLFKGNNKTLDVKYFKVNNKPSERLYLSHSGVPINFEHHTFFSIFVNFKLVNVCWELDLHSYNFRKSCDIYFIFLDCKIPSYFFRINFSVGFISQLQVP